MSYFKKKWVEWEANSLIGISRTYTLFLKPWRLTPMLDPVPVWTGSTSDSYPRSDHVFGPYRGGLLTYPVEDVVRVPVHSGTRLCSNRYLQRPTVSLSF